MERSIQVLLTVGVLSVFIWGCSSSSNPANPPSTAPITQATKPSVKPASQSNTMAMQDVPPTIKGTVKDGIYVSAVDGKPLCPVNDDEVANVKEAKFQVYKGVKYYFCCNSCPSAFKANPKKYAVKK